MNWGEKGERKGKGRGEEGEESVWGYGGLGAMKSASPSSRDGFLGCAKIPTYGIAIRHPSALRITLLLIVKL
jgi:hypothetical protein